MQVLQLANPSSSFFSSKPLPTPLDLSEMFTHLPHPQDLACSIAVYEFAWQPDINIQPTSKQSLACSLLQCFCAQPYNKSELATRKGINSFFSSVYNLKFVGRGEHLPSFILLLCSVHSSALDMSLFPENAKH